MEDSSQDTLKWALALAASRDANGISEAHGLITGIVTGEPDITPTGLWHHWAGLNLEANSDPQDPANPGAEYQSALEAALSALQQALQSSELDFAVLVPSAERSLTERTEGLAHWCGGFLAGFGATGATIQDPEAQDALGLIGEIARAEALDDGDDAANQEQEEQALTEVLEFVKVAVLLLHEDRRAQMSPSQTPAPSNTH